jgi:serine/threonine-protein kinase
MIANLSRCDPGRLRQLASDCLPPGELPELEEHLAHCQDCQTALDRLANEDHWLGVLRQCLGSATKSAGVPAEVGDALDFLAPSDLPDSLGRVGPYEVKGMLGRGGMGVVLKAVDPALNRTIAIKVLAAHLATSGAARQRFLREARAAAAVVHEHVVALHAVDESGKLPYLVMEYVPGRSLQERLDRLGPLTLPEILRIGMQAASGLAAAHAQGLVHRDVKPANILLDHGVERARLTDFGLARAAADASLTQSWVVTGTPHYMSPEQARGETIDHRADLFSLGSTLYAMCTGFPPFRAESAVAVLRRVSDETPRRVRDINPGVPAWLDGIIAQLHAKDPDLRFQSAAEVADLLGRCLAHVQQPDRNPLPALAKKLARQSAGTGMKWRRLRRIAAAAAMVLVLCAGAMALLPPLQPESKVTSEGPFPRVTVAERQPGPLAMDPFEDVFSDSAGQVRQKLAAVERALAGDQPTLWMNQEWDFAHLAGWADAIQHRFGSNSATAVDPVDVQLQMVRHQLELLRQRLERSHD